MRKGLIFKDNPTPPPVPCLRPGDEITHGIRPGRKLVITALPGSVGHVLLLEQNPGDERPNTRTDVPVGGTLKLGPFDTHQNYRVLCDAGELRITHEG